MEYINDHITNYAFRRDPIVISWLKQYLRSSYKKGKNYLYYKGLILCYFQYNNKLIIIGPFLNIIAKIGLRNFKKYCRTKKDLT